MNSQRLLKTKSNHFYTPFHACHIHSHGCEFSRYVPLREKILCDCFGLSNFVENVDLEI